MKQPRENILITNIHIEMLLYPLKNLPQNPQLSK